MGICAVKFDEIIHDWDREQESYARLMEQRYYASLLPYQSQPEEAEEVVYKRNMHKSFNRAFITYLADAGGLSPEAREAIECLEDSIGGGTNRKKCEFPERIFNWLREQRAHLEAYLQGKYKDEIHRFFD